jgi:hypothetical protein
MPEKQACRNAVVFKITGLKRPRKRSLCVGEAFQEHDETLQRSEATVPSGLRHIPAESGRPFLMPRLLGVVDYCGARNESVTPGYSG